jgi:phosphate transport system ATP-binding protein
VSPEPDNTCVAASLGGGHHREVELASFPEAAVVGLVRGDARGADAVVSKVHDASVTVTDKRIVATDGGNSWSWLVADLEAVVHGNNAPWSILVVPEIADFGISVAEDRVDEFRRVLSEFPGLEISEQDGQASANRIDAAAALAGAISGEALPTDQHHSNPPQRAGRRSLRLLRMRDRQRDQTAADLISMPSTLTGIEARSISAWFGTHQVLDRVSLDMRAGEVTALIGPSGCGKSTFLRILNRMHEMIPLASLAGEVMLDGHDVYDPNRKLTEARREIGMVFQKPNPFPAMSIYDNVLASLRLTGVKASVDVKDDIVEACLTKAGLWTEVRDRLREPGGGLSGGQQQRLCIARALAIRPRVLLMDEPCSALDPTSTRRIEETVMELVSEVTIVIVTHNMQQAQRVSDRCAFFLAEQSTPGIIVEHGPTSAMFAEPQDSRTLDYVTGRFG